MKHIVSTLSAATTYNEWANSNGTNVAVRGVTVKGGAGIASPFFVRGLIEQPAPITPEGVITEVSDEDAEFLSKHKLFREHQERGFVRIINVPRDPDTVAQSMGKNDGSRPKNQSDVEKYGKEKGLGKDDPRTGLQAVTNRG